MVQRTGCKLTHRWRKPLPSNNKTNALKESFNKNFGERMRDARINYGITADELGRRINSSGQAYRRYERGEVMPKIDQLLNICDVLGVQLDALVFGNTADTPAIEVTVRPGDRVVIKGEADSAIDAPYNSPVKIAGNAQRPKQTRVKGVKAVENKG